MECISVIIAISHKLPIVPTSAPLAVSVDDVNDSSLTIKWKTPETIGDSGLDGYTIEYCKDGSKLFCMCVGVRVCVGIHAAAPVHQHRVRGQIDSRLGPGPYTAGSMSPAVTVSPETTFSFACLPR